MKEPAEAKSPIRTKNICEECQRAELKASASIRLIIQPRTQANTQFMIYDSLYSQAWN